MKPIGKAAWTLAILALAVTAPPPATADDPAKVIPSPRPLCDPDFLYLGDVVGFTTDPRPYDVPVPSVPGPASNAPTRYINAGWRIDTNNDVEAFLWFVGVEDGFFYFLAWGHLGALCQLLEETIPG